MVSNLNQNPNNTETYVRVLDNPPKNKWNPPFHNVQQWKGHLCRTTAIKKQSINGPASEEHFC